MCMGQATTVRPELVSSVTESEAAVQLLHQIVVYVEDPDMVTPSCTSLGGVVLSGAYWPGGQSGLCAGRAGSRS